MGSLTREAIGTNRDGAERLLRKHFEGKEALMELLARIICQRSDVGEGEAAVDRVVVLRNGSKFKSGANACIGVYLLCGRKF